MTVQALSKEAEAAVKHFESKLSFEMSPIGLKYALQNKEPLQIIDLRTPELFAKGHIPDAVNISYEELSKHSTNLDKEKTTVVYCYDIVCTLAAKAALLLAENNFKVKELIGGWQSWVEHELPVEGKPQLSSCSSSKHSCG